MNEWPQGTSEEHVTSRSCGGDLPDNLRTRTRFRLKKSVVRDRKDDGFLAVLALASKLSQVYSEGA